MNAALACRGLAGPFESLEQLRPAGSSPGNQPQRGSRCGVGVRVIDAELPVPPGHAPDQPVGGDGQHPFQVLGSQHVQGAAHRPGADYFAAVEGAADVVDAGARHPLAHSPENGLQVLGLHRRHPAHCFRDRPKPRSEQALRGEPQPADDPGAEPGAPHFCHGLNDEDAGAGCRAVARQFPAAVQRASLPLMHDYE